MSTELINRFKEALVDSYRPRIVNDATCICCKRKNIAVYLHAIEYYQDEDKELPDYFFPMSASGGIVRGCFPICIDCARPCSKCGLAMRTEKLEESYLELKRKYGSGVVGGIGLDEHMHFGLLLHAIFKRVFKIGRFS
jgi:hypothetical protein